MGCHDSSAILAASQDLARFVEETVSWWVETGARMLRYASICFDVSGCYHMGVSEIGDPHVTIDFIPMVDDWMMTFWVAPLCRTAP